MMVTEKSSEKGIPSPTTSPLLNPIDATTKIMTRASAVKIIEDGPDGMWVTGLPDTAALITVGQEYVAAGTIVSPVYIDSAGGQVVTR